MAFEQMFRAWWQEFYGPLPSAYSEATHLAFALYTLWQPVPAPSDELVALWSDAASGGGEATLAEADRRIAAMAIKWARAEMIMRLWGKDAAE
ncbi:hypothetical protein EBT31_09210 [bacterium]|jgi:hypothetical protein|nr:hypothetical protein [bacterium]